MLPALMVVALLLLAGALYEQAGRQRDRSLPLPGRLIDLGGYRLHLTDRGSGGPTVVLLHGAGDSSYSWLHVQAAIARFTRVLSFDRPGLGGSDPGPGPSPAGSVAELHTLLERSGAPGPYILVGHSLGGLLARLYAVRYPEQVAGLVMVDSTHEFLSDDAKFRQGFTAFRILLQVMRALSLIGLPRLINRVAGAMPMYPELPSYRKQLTPPEYRLWQGAVYRNFAGAAGAAEAREVFTLLAEARRQMRPLGDLPLVVLTNPGFGPDWVEMHRELAGRSTTGVHRISNQKGHNIHMARPDLVVDAVHEVLRVCQSQEKQTAL